MKKPDHVAALERAIEIAGSQSLLAQGIRDYFRSQGKDSSISQQVISYWLTKEIFVDAEYWSAIEHVTAGEVTGIKLRPDVFRRSVVLGEHVD